MRLFEALSRGVVVRILLPVTAKNIKNNDTIQQIDELK